MLDDLGYDDVLATKGGGCGPQHNTVARLCANDVLTVEYRSYEPYLTLEELGQWSEEHKSLDIKYHTASNQHLAQKLVGAHFLNSQAHKMPKEDNPEADSGMPYRYSPDVFEESGAGFQADVLCACPDCNAVAEAGDTPPSRLLTAFGYSYLPKADSEIHQSTPEAVRIENRVVDSFSVIPYNVSRNDGWPIFTFKPKNLPDAKPGVLSNMLGEAIEEADSHG